MGLRNTAFETVLTIFVLLLDGQLGTLSENVVAAHLVTSILSFDVPADAPQMRELVMIPRNFLEGVPFPLIVDDYELERKRSLLVDVQLHIQGSLPQIRKFSSNSTASTSAPLAFSKRVLDCIFDGGGTGQTKSCFLLLTG